MKNDFCLLKGTVSKLRKGEIDEKGLILASSIFAFFCYLFNWRPFLKGKYFNCYVGSHQVEGRLKQVGFNDGDYVEMLVKPTRDDDVYECYAVRIPEQHALIFPSFMEETAFECVKVNFILLTFFVVIICIMVSIIGIFCGESLDYYLNVFKFSFYGLIISTVFFFYAAGGGYAFFCNQILTCLGYSEAWKHSVNKETERFKKLHRAGASELFNDPQTPQFKKLQQFKGGYNYYCTTPILPNWLKIID